MKLLLDTHVFLWCESDEARLYDDLHFVLTAEQNEIFVSAVTAWEIAIKRASGKLAFKGSVAQAIERQPDYNPLPITMEHAEWAGGLPLLHRDPFDRLLVAQAQLEGLILVTVDPQILRYQVPHFPIR